MSFHLFQKLCDWANISDKEVMEVKKIMAPLVGKDAESIILNVGDAGWAIRRLMECRIFSLPEATHIYTFIVHPNNHIEAEIPETPTETQKLNALPRIDGVGYPRLLASSNPNTCCEICQTKFIQSEKF